MLRCGQCGAIDAGPGLGWRAMLGLEDDGETETVAIYRPECAEREFGPIERPRKRLTAWTVPAIVVRVVDGDTVIVNLDLAWRVYRNEERIRCERHRGTGDPRSLRIRDDLDVPGAVRPVRWCVYRRAS